MGIPVILVEPGSHAANAGIVAGDIIRKIDDVVIENAFDYVEAVKKRVGVAKIEIERNGTSMIVEMVIGPSSPLGGAN